MKKVVAAVILLLILAAVFVATRQWPGSMDKRENMPATSADAADHGAAVATISFKTGLEGLPASLRGTDVDGELKADANGHLLINNGVRRTFDYFLSATGEEPLAQILARLKAYIRHKLPPSASLEAEQLLDSYMAYKQAAENAPQQQVTSADGNINLTAMRQQMQLLAGLRQQYFSRDAISAFFGDDDAYDSYTLARLELMENNNLNAEQRAQRMTALENELPEAMRESTRVVRQYQDLETLTSDWQKRGGSSAELRRIRESIVGPDAADRLEKLDQETHAWDQRMDSWLQERNAILSNPALGSIDRQQQLDNLRQQRFSDAERLRVESLERMHDRGER